MKKHFLIILTAAAMVCGIIGGSMSAVMAKNESVNIVINGSPLQTDQGAEIYDGRTFLPVRAVAEAMNAEVVWNEEYQGIFIEKDGVVLILAINVNIMGSTTDGVNITDIPLDAAPRIVNDRTLVPIRAIGEEFGWNVSWDDDTRTVSISDGSVKTNSTSRNDTSSKGSSSGGSISSPRTERTRCNYCNGRGTRDCRTCGGKGTVTERGSTPNYSGKRPGSYSVTKSCPNVRCHGGKVDCSFCGGDGWR